MTLVASTGSFSMTRLTANAFGIDPPPASPTPLMEWRVDRGEHRRYSFSLSLLATE